MRVLHVSQPTEAGVPNVLLEYVGDGVAKGHEMHVACPETSGYLAAEARRRGARHHRWEATRSPGPTVVAEALRLRDLVGMVDPDVVFLHASKAGLAGRLALRGSRPTVVMPHSWSFEAADGVVGTASRWWERLGSRWTTVTLCVSDREREVGRRARCLGPRAVVIPNGVDTSRWTPTDGSQARARLGIPARERVVVCVGRLAPQKGQDLLLQAWPAVREQVPDARLYLVGDGPQRELLEGMARGGVTFVGQADPHDWFAAADVVMLPSRWEGMALVLLEAMSSGACVVSTDVAGAREALGDNDRVVPIAAEALVEPLLRRLRDPDLRQREGAGNREAACRRFTMRETLERVSNLLQEL